MRQTFSLAQPSRLVPREVHSLVRAPMGCSNPAPVSGHQMSTSRRTSDLPLVNRIFLAVLSLLLASWALYSIHLGAIQLDRSATHVAGRNSDPVVFWVIVGVDALLSIGAMFVAVTGRNRVTRKP
jgi:hypothetical protein